MRFGKTLRSSIYAPWKDKYIDYDKLKRILREAKKDAGSGGELSESDNANPWTERDVEIFVVELVNVQLEKVNQFHGEQYRKLQDRTDACQKTLDELAQTLQGSEQHTAEDDDISRSLRGALQELDYISKDVKELEKYARLNYTGFLKACKKHDKRTEDYKVRHVLMVRLAILPFNREDYSPLLFRLAAMYSFVRRHLEDGENITNPFPDQGDQYGGFRSHKCK